jgi:hypothetical protein
MEPKRLRPINNIKRSLTLSSNYSILVACKLLLDTAAEELKRNNCISSLGALHNAMNLIPLQEIHKFSQVKARAIRHRAFVLCAEMIDEFHKDVLKYFKETGIPPKELHLEVIGRQQLEYLSTYLTYQMEGKIRPTAPLALLRNKLATKKFPVKERTALKILSITPIPKKETPLP